MNSLKTLSHCFLSLEFLIIFNKFLHKKMIRQLHTYNNNVYNLFFQESKKINVHLIFLLEFQLS